MPNFTTDLPFAAANRAQPLARIAGSDDGEALREYLDRAHLRERQRDERPLFPLEMPTALKRGRLAVTHCGEELAGFAALSTRHGERRGAIVNRIFVRPQFRRQGYGSALVSVLTDAAGEQGLFGIRAYVPRAEGAFWTAQGFQLWRNNPHGHVLFGKMLAPPQELPDGPRIPVRIDVERRSEAGEELPLVTHFLEAVETEPGAYALSAVVPLAAQWPRAHHAPRYRVKVEDRETVSHKVDLSFLYGADRLPWRETDGQGDAYVLRRFRDEMDLTRV